MIRASSLSLVMPHEASPGTLLIGGAHYRDPPLLMFELNGELYYLEMGGQRPFWGYPIVNSLNPQLAIEGATILVDFSEKISPTRADIPLGSVTLIDGDVCLAAKVNHATTYVRLDGAVIDEKMSRMVAFPKWQIVVPKANMNECDVVFPLPNEE